MKPGSTLMETYEYRRERLRQLLHDEYGDNQSALARAIGVSRGAINDFLTSARRTLGERPARRIEEKLGLAPNSLDQPIEWQDRSGDRRRSQAKKPKRLERVAA